MGKNPETRLVNQILKTLRHRGGWWVKIHGSPWQTSGLPDILGCYEGRFVGFEVKLPEGELSPRQGLIRKRITEAGGIYQVVRNVDQAIKVVTDLSN